MNGLTGPASRDGVTGVPLPLPLDSEDRRGLGGRGSIDRGLAGGNSLSFCEIDGVAIKVCGGGGGGAGRIRINISSEVDNDDVAGVFYPLESGSYGKILDEIEE